MMEMMRALTVSMLMAFAGAAAAQPETAAQLAVRVARLPLVEVPATTMPASPLVGRMVVLLSGDGGWASLDRSIAASFARRGIPTVGINSLRYFWSARKPEEAASDVGAVIEHYLARWRLEKVDLIGFSFGADVVPFIANRLPAAAAAHVGTVTMIEPSQSATFEVHVSDWLPGAGTAGLPLAPEVRQLKPAPLCLHGDDAASPCSNLPGAQVDRIGSGHHLGGDGEPIVARILR